MKSRNPFDVSHWKGEWALISGASSGIGLEFCRQLAARGLNLVMVARDQTRLHEEAGRLQVQHRIQALTIPIDLTTYGAPQVIKDQLDAKLITIRLLVNCAGFGFWGRFEEGSACYDEMIRLHAQVPIFMCLTFLPDLASHPTSAVIHVSSQAAFNPIPFMNVYAAAKAFQHQFSLALYEEWKRFGIRVQTLVPGPTRTNFNQRVGITEASPSGFRWKQANEVVEISLRRLSQDSPMALAAAGVFSQRLFAFVIPIKLLLRKTAIMFQRGPGSPSSRLAEIPARLHPDSYQSACSQATTKKNNKGRNS